MEIPTVSTHNNPLGKTKECVVVDLARSRPCFTCVHVPARGVYCHEPHEDCNINNDWKRYEERVNE